MSGPREVRAFAPASVSNVGCGFDVLGFALEGLWLGEDSPPVGDVVHARRVDAPGVRIVAIRGARGLPVDAERNTAGVAARAVVARTGDLGDIGVELSIDKCMPLRSGLGSSAASAVAAALATDALLEARLPAATLLRCALAGEQLASGTLHADNVAPALYGGFVLVRSLEPEPEVVILPTPRSSSAPWCRRRSRSTPGRRATRCPGRCP